MSTGVFILLIGLLLIAAILVLFWHPQRSRTNTSRFVDQQRADSIYRDDDRYWIGGVFYNNPDDPAILVPKRYGMGWTVNFGNPRGRLFMFATLLIPLVLLILTILLTGTAPAGCHPSGCNLFP